MPVSDALRNQWVDLFRADDYGENGKFTAEDLHSIAENYDPTFSAAPLVKGHPKTDDEAHGWVQGMRVVTDKIGAKLQGLFEGVKDETAELMKSGAFRNRSVAIYGDLKGRGLYLRHVGLLGAVPPGVKALEPVKFDDGEAKFSAVDFEDDKPVEAKPDDDGKKGKETEGNDDPLTRVEVKTMFEKFAENLSSGMNRILGKAGFGKSFTASGEARIVGGGTEMADTDKKIEAALAKERALSSARNFVEKMKAEKKWIPAFTEAGLDKMLEILAVEQTAVAFGEAGKEKEATTFEMVKTLLGSIPDLVPTKGLPAVGKRLRAGAAQFAEADPRGAQFDADSVHVAEKMEEIFVELKKADPKMPDQEARRQAYDQARLGFDSSGGGGQPSAGVA